MQEREFYEQILGLRSPWYVSEGKLDSDNQRVDVFVEQPLSASQLTGLHDARRVRRRYFLRSGFNSVVQP